MQKKQIKYCIIAVISTVVAILLDQWTKFLSVTHLKNKAAIEVVKGVFELQYLENKGAAFGIMQNQQVFFLISGILILLVATYVYIKLPQTKRFHLLRICIVLIISGAIGNMIDRLRFQYVIDFFYFKLIDFPIFNVADIYVVMSCILLVILILFKYEDSDFKFLSLKNR